MVVRERAEALERQRLAEYIVWRKREGFQEKREDRDRERKHAGKGNGDDDAAPEVIWKRRDEEGEAVRDRAIAIQKGHETIWRKRERE